MKKLQYMLASAIGLWLGANSQVLAAKLTISCGAVGKEMVFCKQAVNAWAKKTGHEVQIMSMPNSSTDRLATYQQFFAARSKDLDVVMIDVIWPGILASHLLDLNKYLPKDYADQFFPAMWNNNQVNGRQVAVPWHSDSGLLFYRKDLLTKYKLEVPKTWAALDHAAEVIQKGERAAGNDRFWGLVFQARAYEGLTCNALEWIYSHGGGSLVDDQGQVTVNNPKAVAALDKVASWIGRIAPEGVLNYTEEEARGVFQTGNAAFLRNWPYVWPLAEADDSPVKAKVGVTKLPKGPEGNHTGTLGGWGLAVSKYSENPKVAVDLVQYLAQASEQKRWAIDGGYNPTMPALYKDPDVVRVNPFMADLFEVFESSQARPSAVTGKHYNRVSFEFWNAVHSVLSGKEKAEAALKDLDRKLQRISRRGKW